jgi:ATP-dependent DNA helicase DinG
MNFEDRFSAQVLETIRAEIADASGNEVLFVGFVEPGSHRISRVKAVARGTRDMVPALAPHMNQGDVVVHNHPSGILLPSGADLGVAGGLGQQGIGFWIVDNAATDCYAVSEPVQAVVPDLLPADEAAAHLLPGGSFQTALGSFESRSSQVELVKLFTRGFNEDGIVMAEAGTGVGKSFAYLIPSLLWASRNKERVVVSTATINLQQQLFEKDIPLVQKALGTSVKAVLVKGRRNYLCPHRLADELKEVTFESTIPVDQLNAIADWAGQTRTGDVAELGFVPDDALWGRLCSDQDVCHGVRCAQKDGCFLARARKEAAGAGLLVANHHLLFADLALRMNGFGSEATAVLPPFQRIVFDEAHHIEKSATSYFSAEFNRPFLLKLLGRLYRQRRGRASGIILTLQGLGTEAIDFGLFPTLVAEAAEKADSYNLRALEVLGGTSSLRLAGSEGARALDQLLEPLTELQKPLLQLAELCKRLAELWEKEREVPAEAWEVKTIGGKLEGLSQTIDRCRKFDQDPGSVYWLDRLRDGFGNAHVELVISPLTIDKLMVQAVYEPYGTVLMTSATLAVRGEFGFWSSRVGLNLVDPERRLSGIFPSPFDYGTRVLTGCPVDFPSPDQEAYQSRLESYLPDLLGASGGSALVLFTSYESMKAAYAKIQPVLADRGISLYRQGEAERGRLLSRFKAEITSVLFATDSFWEGVDSPGDTLRLVVLCRLPFRVPSDPVLAARMEDLERRGLDSFMNFSLPEAVTRFKQGFGRLIRHSDDSGAVVVLDTRLVRKSYGSLFLASVPETRRAFVPAAELVEAVKRFLERT